MSTTTERLMSIFDNHMEQRIQFKVQMLIPLFQNIIPSDKILDLLTDIAKQSDQYDRLSHQNMIDNKLNAEEREFLADLNEKNPALLTKLSQFAIESSQEYSAERQEIFQRVLSDYA